jgi:adenylate kinase family enzyme
MRRVLVIGISGAGKSTFARELARRTGLPLIHLDKEFWRPGWVTTPLPEWRAKVEALAARDAWIMDGNYGATLDLRLPRADAVIWFDYPRLRCLRQIAWRIATTYGRVRPDLAPGCPEQIDLEFLRFVWDFPAKSRPAIVTALQKHRPAAASLVIFRRRRDVSRYLAGLGQAAL